MNIQKVQFQLTDSVKPVHGNVIVSLIYNLSPNRRKDGSPLETNSADHCAVWRDWN